MAIPKSLVLVLFTLVTIVDRSSCTNGGQIPMQMRMRMKSVRSTSDFIHTMVQDRKATGTVLQPMENQIYEGDTRRGFNQQGVELMASVIATPDVCEPRLRTVAIPPNSDPRIIYWPTCTPVQRCGGCCGLDLLECTATNVTTITVQVMKQKMSATDSTRYEYLGNEYITLEKHLSCDCHCRVKQSDCNPETQDYDEDSCSCRCRNTHQATSCPSPKRWDDKYCRCVCPVLINCLDDEYFDFNICSCVRGTPVVSGDASAFNVGTNPCTPSQDCRHGTRPTRVGSRCLCRP